MVYFKNLNGIRFLAAFLVIIHHIEQMKNAFNLESFWEYLPIQIIGRLGVVLFFLSKWLSDYLSFA